MFPNKEVGACCPHASAIRASREPACLSAMYTTASATYASSKIQIEHNGEIHSFSGTTPVWFWKRGEYRKAIEMIVDPFYDLSDREIKYNLEIMLQGKEV